MFENLFTSSPSVWSSLIAGMVALPILIHLINLLRHQRVEWAAMEFLLQSHKKNRNWVWLKQLLLLLSRIAILLLALFMLAQAGCHEDRISRLLGGSTTHHYILLDDSFSMGDRGGEGTAFDRANSILGLIAKRAKNRHNQLVTLLRYSSDRAVSADEASRTDELPVASSADLNGVLVDNLFDQKLDAVKSGLEVSHLSSHVDGVLRSAQQLIRDRKNENAIVYVVSDFRKQDWQNPENAKTAFEQIHDAGAGIELIRCADAERTNLAVTALLPAGNVRVAGTPLMMQVSVKNCSTVSAEKIQVQLATIAISDSPGGGAGRSPKMEELPTVFIQDIPAGETATRLFPVFFESSGQHIVFADLPVDAVMADNRRWCSTEFRTATKVLLIDDSQQHSGFLSLALNPNRMTGIQSEIKTKDFLRDVNSEALRQYDVIFLLDVDSLGESATKNLESFVHAGGGLAIFVGERTNVSGLNESMYRDGVGLLPMPLGKMTDIPEMMEDRVPDVSPNDHPIFAPVLGVKNSLLSLVQIKTVIQPTIQWNAGQIPFESDSLDLAARPAQVIATVRGNDRWPLVVEKGFGNGNVVLFTTTAGPLWNNWSRNATFPPILLLLEDYLATGKYPSNSNVVGTSLTVDVAADEYLPDAEFLEQATDQLLKSPDQPTAIDVRLRPSSAIPGRLVGLVGAYSPGLKFADTDKPGVYDLRLTTTDSDIQTQRYAFNVDTLESEMELVDSQMLLASLESANPTLVDWKHFNPDPKQKPVSSLGKFLLLLLMVVLLCEQVLAYSASYHR